MSLKPILALALAATAAVTSSGTAQSVLPSQSPVNITRSAVRFDPNQPALRVNYGTSALELKYIRKDQTKPNGCTTRDHEETEEAEVQPGSGHVTVAGTRYDLVQFHFHTPSEHRFGGHAFPLEMHLVHRSAAGKLLVIGVPLREGPRSAVDHVLAKLAPECGEPVEVSAVDLDRLLPVNRKTLHYNGSLTTAPFTEGVSWYLTSERTVSHATLKRFRDLFVNGNAREVQPLNGRTFAPVPRT